MSIIATLATLAQVGYGIYQSQQGRKLAEEAEANRPQYRMPESLKQAMLSAELRSLEGLPGETKSLMSQETDRSRMSSLAQINERRGGLGAVAQLEQNQQDAIRQQAVMDVQQRDKNLQNLQSMRLQMAQQEQAQWQWDEAQRYQTAAGTASAMQGAGLQNIFGGITSLGTMAAGGVFNKNKPPASTDAAGTEFSTARMSEVAGQYTVKPEDMVFKDNQWTPREGAMSPYGETWDATTGGWRDDAMIGSVVEGDKVGFELIPPSQAGNVINPQTGGGVVASTSPTTSPITSSTTSDINTSAANYGVSVEDMEQINGVWYPKEGTINSSGQIFDSKTGTFIEPPLDSPLIQGGLGGAPSGSEGENIVTPPQQEIITEQGEVNIVDNNNNQVPDEFETIVDGQLIDTRTNTPIVSDDESAEIINDNDQINTALKNSGRTDIATNESSLRGQVSESNQIAAAKNYGIDRSNLELVDGNWVPKEGSTSIYGDTWDSNIGGWRDDATTSSDVYSDEKTQELSDNLKYGESQLNSLIEEGKGLKTGTPEYKENIRKRDELSNKLRNLNQSITERQGEQEIITAETGIQGGTQSTETTLSGNLEKRDAENEQKYQEHVEKNKSSDVEWNSKEDIIASLSDEGMSKINNDGTITLYSSNKDDREETSKTMTVEELLDTVGRERISSVLGRKEKKYNIGMGGRKTVYKYGTVESVRNEDGSRIETITITSENHPLYGKTYTRTVKDNPERNSKTIISEAESVLSKNTSTSEPYVGGSHGRDFDMSRLESMINNGQYKNPHGSEMTDEQKNNLISELEGLYYRYDSPNITTTTLSNLEKTDAEDKVITTWRDNKDIDSKRVDRFSIQGSSGENKANILKDGNPITAKVAGGLAEVTGVRAKGDELIVDVEVGMAARIAGEKSGPKTMGKFVKSGDSYKFEPNKEVYSQLTGEDLKDFDAFVKAVESDPEFAKQLLASVSGTTDFNPSEYGIK